MAQPGLKQAVPAAPEDVELVRRALARDGGAFRAIMQKHNRRLYRIARGILRNNADAEDAVQDAYVSAFANLGSFRGESALATWLSRIVMNAALGRLRKRNTVDIAAREPARSEAEIIQFLYQHRTTTRNERWRSGKSFNLWNRRPTTCRKPFDWCSSRG